MFCDKDGIPISPYEEGKFPNETEKHADDYILVPTQQALQRKIALADQLRERFDQLKQSPPQWKGLPYEKAWESLQSFSQEMEQLQREWEKVIDLTC